RGIKPKVAAERGAIGCLIYSDPRDDGYFVDGVFPDGPMRSKDGVRRGSVMDMPTYPGDPTTPGRGSTPGVTRLDVKDVTTLTRIPVLPISYGDAQPLLAALGGTVAPMDWRGSLPITYRIGPGPARVHLKGGLDWGLKRAPNGSRGRQAPRIRTSGWSVATITTRGSTARRTPRAGCRWSSKRRARSDNS